MKSVEDVKLYRFRKLGDAEGFLVPIEATKDVPFEIRRIFYVSGVPSGGLRGKHGHRSCQQFLICLRGRCEITFDDGQRKRTVILDSLEQGAYLPPTIWAEQRYLDPDTLLMVLTDQFYDEADYLRDYGEFLMVRKNLVNGVNA